MVQFADSYAVVADDNDTLKPIPRTTTAATVRSLPLCSLLYSLWPRQRQSNTILGNCWRNSALILLQKLKKLRQASETKRVTGTADGVRAAMRCAANVDEMKLGYSFDSGSWIATVIRTSSNGWIPI